MRTHSHRLTEALVLVAQPVAVPRGLPAPLARYFDLRTRQKWGGRTPIAPRAARIQALIHTYNNCQLVCSLLFLSYRFSDRSYYILYHATGPRFVKISHPSGTLFTSALTIYEAIFRRLVSQQSQCKGNTCHAARRSYWDAYAAPAMGFTERTCLNIFLVIPKLLFLRIDQ